MNLGVFHSEYINKPIEIPLGPEFVPFPGQPPIGPVAPGQIPGGMVVGGPDHLILGNLSGHIDDSHTQSHAHGHGHGQTFTPMSGAGPSMGNPRLRRDGCQRWVQPGSRNDYTGGFARQPGCVAASGPAAPVSRYPG